MTNTQEAYHYRDTFRAVYDQYAELGGRPFTVQRVITEADATHDHEVLPMFVIAVAGQDEPIEAWPEEVLDYDCYAESYNERWGIPDEEDEDEG